MHAAQHACVRPTAQPRQVLLECLCVDSSTFELRRPSSISELGSGLCLRCISVYDGDTITVAARIDGAGRAYLFKVRLSGIDCAERKGGSGGAAEKRVRLIPLR